MKTFIILSFLASLAYSLKHDSHEIQVIRENLPKDALVDFDNFLGFMKKYDKEYSNSLELHGRFEIFLHNLRRITKSQANEGGTAIHGVTQFFDFTPNEFKKKFTGLKLTHKKRLEKHDLSELELKMYEQAEAPNSIDWRKKGAVTAVKNQGGCGSCFSFGAIGAVEGQWFKKTGKLIPFSEQEVLECGADACGGGDPLHVYDTIAEIGGLETETDYPYIAGNGKIGNCTTNEKKFVAYVNGSRALPLHDEELLKKVLAVEDIDASWIFDYESGIINPKNQPKGPHPEDINHAVLLVGYGTDTQKGLDYWIVKNSWGSKFGEDGYFRVVRGTDALYLVDSNPSLPLIY